MIDEDSKSNLQAIPIADVWQALGYQLTNRGNQHCFSPVHKHGDRKPSLGFKDNKFTCFGCGIAGDTIGLVQESQGLGFRESAEWLANQFNVSLGVSSSKNTPVHEDKAKIAHRALQQAERPYKNRESIRNRDFTYDMPHLEVYQTFYDNSKEPKKDLLEFWKNKGFSSELLKLAGWRSITQDTWNKTIKTHGKKKLLKAGLLTMKDGKAVPSFYNYTIVVPFYGVDKLIYLRARGLRKESATYYPPVNTSMPIYNYRVFATWSGDTPIYITESETDCLALQELGHVAVALSGGAKNKTSLLIQELAHVLVNGFGGRSGLLDIRIVADKDATGEKFYEANLEALLDLAVPIESIKKVVSNDEAGDMADELKLTKGAVA